jgi:hypothetical protein
MLYQAKMVKPWYLDSKASISCNNRSVAPSSNATISRFHNIITYVNLHTREKKV